MSATSGITPSFIAALKDERIAVFSELAECILVDGAYKATKYLNDKLTIKATRKLFKYNGRKVDGRSRTMEIVFTIGKPNYEEREVIKRNKREGLSLSGQVSEKFPK